MRLRTWLGLCLTAALMGSCAPIEAPDESPTSGDAPQTGGTVVVASGADIGGLNPLTHSRSSFTREVQYQMFLRLLVEQADYEEHPPTFRPSLAESYSWSDDQLTLVMRLRKDARWSDGHAVTAEDVVWTHEAQTSPEVAWSYAQSKDGIEAVEMIDPHTVAFRFREVYSTRLAEVNEGSILPKHVWSRLPFSEWRRRDDWFREHLVVSGPFTLTSWRPEQEIVLERNPEYYRAGYPRVDRVVIRIVPERKNQLEQLLSGQVDYIKAMRPAAAARVESSKRAKVISYWHRQYVYLGWNGCKAPFDRPAVLRALTQAIDRETLVRSIYSDYARLAVSPIISSVWAFDRSLEPWPYDPEAARAALAAEGWQDSDGDSVLDRDGVPFRFKLSTNSDNPMRVDAATMIRQHLAEIGVDAVLDLMEFNTLISSNEAHDFDASIGSWAIDTSLDLTYAFHSDSIDEGQNYGCYTNTEVDRLIELARRQDDIAEAGDYLRQIQQILHEEQPYTFLWEPKRLDGASRRLQDARPNPLSTFDNLEEWWLAPAG